MSSAGFIKKIITPHLREMKKKPELESSIKIMYFVNYPVRKPRCLQWG
jgi:hypothetical protein